MRILQKLFLFGLMAVVLSACIERNSLLVENANGSRIPPDTLISVESSAPLERYTYIISANGEVVYQQTTFTGYSKPIATQGDPVKSNIGQDQLEQIVREFENQEFFSLNDQYQMGENGCEGGVRDAGNQSFQSQSGEERKMCIGTVV